MIRGRVQNCSSAQRTVKPLTARAHSLEFYDVRLTRNNGQPSRASCQRETDDTVLQRGITLFECLPAQIAVSHRHPRTARLERRALYHCIGLSFPDEDARIITLSAIINTPFNAREYKGRRERGCFFAMLRYSLASNLYRRTAAWEEISVCL